MDDLYNVVIQGRTVPGIEIDDVQENLVNIFNASPEKIKSLLSGKPVIVKKKVSHKLAHKIMQKIKKAGAECKVVKYDNQISKPIAMEKTGKPDAYSNVDSRSALDRKPDKIEKSQELSGVNPYQTPSSTLTTDEKYCESCGQIIKIKAEICPKCGVRQRRPISKAALLLITFFLGGIGAHKFYLGKHWQGVFYLLFFWTYIPSLVALVEFIIYAFTSSERLQEKYSAGSGSLVVVVIAGAFVVIAVVGILAAIAIPNFIAYRNKAYQHNVQAELQNLFAAEQTYFAEHNMYSADFEALNYAPEGQDIIIEIISADQNCFEASGRHIKLADSLDLDCNGIKE